MEKNNDVSKKRESNAPDRTKLVLVGAVIAGLVLTIVAAVVFGVFNSPSGSSGSESDNDFASMLPIWIAIWGGVFIPQFAMRKKQAQVENSREKIIVMSVILGLVIAGLAGLVLYMLLA